jgi:hypothetical protein
MTITPRRRSASPSPSTPIVTELNQSTSPAPSSVLVPALVQVAFAQWATSRSPFGAPE